MFKTLNSRKKNPQKHGSVQDWSRVTILPRKMREKKTKTPGPVTFPCLWKHVVAAELWNPYSVMNI